MWKIEQIALIIRRVCVLLILNAAPQQNIVQYTPVSTPFFFISFGGQNWIYCLYILLLLLLFSQRLAKVFIYTTHESGLVYQFIFFLFFSSSFIYLLKCRQFHASRAIWLANEIYIERYVIEST